MIDREAYTCIDCEHFGWCKLTPDGYCFKRKQYVEPDFDTCDDFILDDYIGARED